MLKHVLTDRTRGTYAIMSGNALIGEAHRNQGGFAFHPKMGKVEQHRTMAALKASLASPAAPIPTVNVVFGDREVIEPLFKDKPVDPTDHVARYKINDTSVTDPMKKFFGLGWLFERPDGTFDRAHSQMDSFGNYTHFQTKEEALASIVAFDGSEDQIWAMFDDLVCRLSPENLACDGEISASQINKRHAQIMREWKVLEKKLGRAVSQDEAEAHCYKLVLA